MLFFLNVIKGKNYNFNILLSNFYISSIVHSQKKYECAETKTGLAQPISYEPSQIKTPQPSAPSHPTASVVIQSVNKSFMTFCI